MRATSMSRLRWCRASLLAAVALVTGSVAHVSGDGLLPGPVVMGVLFVLLILGCAWLLDPRKPSPVRTVVLVVGGQTLMHVALAATAGHRGTSITPSTPPELVFPASGRRGALMDQMPYVVDDGLAVPAWMTHGIQELTGPQAPMAFAHLAACAVVGLWLAYGEAALFAVIALAVAAVARLLVVAWPVVLRSRVSPAYDARVRRLCCLLSGIVLARRGPPAAVPATA